MTKSWWGNNSSQYPNAKSNRNKNPKNYECVERKPRGGVKLDLKTKTV